MKTISKALTIVRKTKVSDFMIANFKVLGDSGNHNIGGSVSAENAMLVNEEELASYLPNIIGVSPTSPSWGQRLDNYVRSVSVPVPSNGLSLEVGFVFDELDLKYKAAFKAYRVENKFEDASEEDVIDHIVANVHRNYWWKYGRPINAADYFLWRFCQNYKKVANTLKDADNKSLDIKYYIVDEDDVKKEQKRTFDIKNKSAKLYYQVSSKPEDVRAALFLLKMGKVVLNKPDAEDHLMALDQAKDLDPTEFIRVCSNLDKLKDQAFIEECIERNILTRAANSTLIIDANSGDALGGNLVEAVAYLNDQANTKYKNTLVGMVNNKSI